MSRDIGKISRLLLLGHVESSFGHPVRHCRRPIPGIRHDIIDTAGSVTLRHAGRLHHIGIGRTHARTPIIMLIENLDIRIIDTTTGELLRHLTLDPTRDYQPHTKTIKKTPKP